MNKYNQLREEIIKCCPEIMRLEFGCRIKYIEGAFSVWDYKFDEKKEYVIKGIEGEFFQVGEIKKYHCEFINGTVDNMFKIIGRDITLENCLIAGKGNIGIHGNRFMYKDYSYSDVPYKWVDSCVDFDLNKPLQDQPKETIELLYNLICKK